ncbi:MAG: hypothetical protein Alpg2KO_19370 [Alphaproteobacteria bacterium]
MRLTVLPTIPAIALTAALATTLASPVDAAGLKRVELPQLALLSAPADGVTAPATRYKRLPRPAQSQELPIMAQIEQACETDGYVGKRFVADDAADASADNTVTRAQLPSFSRVLRPGDMATMDYHPNRLNLMLDDADVVIEAKCG